VSEHDTARPGRRCPTGYRTRPEALRALAPIPTETVYVVGGLYGNREALHTILRMKAEEETLCRQVTLVFNGDFNWFNVDGEDFAQVNTAVLQHMAVRGNVETELVGAGADIDCGCAYPDYVGDDTVRWSNAIMARLRAAAAGQPALARRLRHLPMQLAVLVGELAIGIIHGDPESLAGWSLAVERMTPPDVDLRRRLGCRVEDVTTETQIAQWLQCAGVRAFACSHTCLPFAQDLFVVGQRCLVINNGAAGMPNFAGRRFGVITRISAAGAGPFEALYGTSIDGVRFEALAVPYDHDAWMRRFSENWPPGSPAYASYARRLLDGPDFSTANAARLGDASRVRQSS
jgi:hypothetical protein